MSATDYYDQVKRLDFKSPNGADSLLMDLRRWRQDVVPDYTSAPLPEDLLFGS
jgi:hypothetical protein